MDKETLKQSFDNIAAQGVKPNRDVWPRVRSQVQAGAAHSAWWVRLTPAARLGWALVLLVGILSIGMTVYAAAPVIGRLFIMDDQLKNQDYSKLGQHYELSQTQGDVTVTLQWAYADASRVLVGYAVRTADGRRFDTASTLSDDRGAVYTSNGLRRHGTVGPAAGFPPAGRRRQPGQLYAVRPIHRCEELCTLRTAQSQCRAGWGPNLAAALNRASQLLYLPDPGCDGAGQQPQWSGPT